ncbi:PDDEXK family nuclease [Helicobacter monodelphidis]
MFIAPYLDKNVLNDFRSRISCYFENDTNHIKGMKILPISTQDLINILYSNMPYADLLPRFYQVLKSKEMWGSKWYQNEIKKIIET